MGVIKLFSDSKCCKCSETKVVEKFVGPDVSNFEIKDICKVGEYTVTKIHYPDFFNKEGAIENNK